MKKYDSYKDSGIEWIGEIPSHWDVTRIKYKFQIGRGRVISNEDLVEDGIYPVYSSQTLNNGCLGFIDTYDFDDKLITWTTDGANAGTVFLREGKFNCTNVCGTLKAKSDEIIPEYDYYFLQYATQFYKRPDTNGAKIMNNEMAVILSLKLSNEEQTAIANYLDQKTSQIDDLIAKKERLIQLLEEERTAIINHAVTKGLDPTVPMKDSGIEWLGEIPAHWVEARIKNVVNIIGRIGFRGYTTQDLVQKGEGAISLSPSNIKNHILNIDDCTYLSWEKYNESPEIKIFENDIILVKTGSTIGKTAIIPNGTPEMTLNPQLVVFKDIKLNPVFLYYIMISNYFQGYFSIYTAGGSTPAISQEKINNFKITFPSELEQLEISSFISQKESEIKKIISKTQQEIELLKEYKTALVSEVVTGKVDVRDVVLN